MTKDKALKVMEKETEKGLWDPELFRILKYILNDSSYDLDI